MSHAQGTGDLAQITFGVGPVLHHRRPADDFELSNLGQTIENLVLDTVGKVGVVLIGAELSKGRTSILFSACIASRPRSLK
jgi:hypothetical protein